MTAKPGIVYGLEYALVIGDLILAGEVLRHFIQSLPFPSQ